MSYDQKEVFLHQFFLDFIKTFFVLKFSLQFNDYELHTN